MKQTSNRKISSIRQHIVSFFGLFGFKREGKYAKYIWRTFATSATIAMVLFAYYNIQHIYSQIRADQFYEHFMASTGDCIAHDIYFVPYSEGYGGYVMNKRTGEKLIKNVAWIHKPLEGDSLVCYSDGKLRGYFHKYSGKVVIPPRYKHAWVFSCGMAAVEEDSKIKFIDSTGKVVIDNGMKWDGCSDGYVFHGGYLVVASADNHKYGLMDRSGKLVLPYECDDINISCNLKYWRVRKGNQTAVYDEHLDLVFPYTDGYTYFTDSGFNHVKPDNMVCSYDYSGNLVNDFCIFAVRHLEYDTDEIIYKGEVYTDDDGNRQAYFSEGHKKATARLRAYEAGNCNEGLMTQEGKMVTMPLYKNIEAIGPDTYLCSLSDEEKVVVNGRGEVVK